MSLSPLNSTTQPLSQLNSPPALSQFDASPALEKLELKVTTKALTILQAYFSENPCENARLFRSIAWEQDTKEEAAEIPQTRNNTSPASSTSSSSSTPSLSPLTVSSASSSSSTPSLSPLTVSEDFTRYYSLEEIQERYASLPSTVLGNPALNPTLISDFFMKISHSYLVTILESFAYAVPKTYEYFVMHSTQEELFTHIGLSCAAAYIKCDWIQEVAKKLDCHLNNRREIEQKNAFALLPQISNPYARYEQQREIAQRFNKILSHKERSSYLAEIGNPIQEEQRLQFLAAVQTCAQKMKGEVDQPNDRNMNHKRKHDQHTTLNNKRVQTEIEAFKKQ